MARTVRPRAVRYHCRAQVTPGQVACVQTRTRAPRRVGRLPSTHGRGGFR
jgi:hypothetical protein